MSKIKVLVSKCSDSEFEETHEIEDSVTSLMDLIHSYAGQEGMYEGWIFGKKPIEESAIIEPINDDSDIKIKITLYDGYNE